MIGENNLARVYRMILEKGKQIETEKICVNQRAI